MKIGWLVSKEEYKMKINFSFNYVKDDKKLMVDSFALLLSIMVFLVVMTTNGFMAVIASLLSLVLVGVLIYSFVLKHVVIEKEEEF